MRLVRSNILSKQRIFPGGKHKYNTRLPSSPPPSRIPGQARLVSYLEKLKIFLVQLVVTEFPGWKIFQSVKVCWSPVLHPLRTWGCDDHNLLLVGWGPIGGWTERPVFNRYFTFSLLERPAIWGPTIYFPPIHPADNSEFNLGNCNSIHSGMKNLSTVEKILD